jgi:hypothetical protein
VPEGKKNKVVFVHEIDENDVDDDLVYVFCEDEMTVLCSKYPFRKMNE